MALALSLRSQGGQMARKALHPAIPPWPFAPPAYIGCYRQRMNIVALPGLVGISKIPPGVGLATQFHGMQEFSKFPQPPQTPSPKSEVSHP